MRIYLLGYMGCGKSTAGKKLAARLGYAFRDLDQYIGEREKRSISDFFAAGQEDEFRKIEHRSLVELSASENLVIACGGGTPCFYNNMDLIRESGISIYLKMEPATLVNRLWNAHQERPLLKGKDKKELRDFIQQHLAEREKYYSRATHTLDARNLKTEQIIALLPAQTR